MVSINDILSRFKKLHNGIGLSIVLIMVALGVYFGVFKKPEVIMPPKEPTPVVQTPTPVVQTSITAEQQLPNTPVNEKCDIAKCNASMKDLISQNQTFSDSRKTLKDCVSCQSRWYITPFSSSTNGTDYVEFASIDHVVAGTLLEDPNVKRYQLKDESNGTFTQVIPEFDKWMSDIEKEILGALYVNPLDACPVQYITIHVMPFEGVAYAFNSTDGSKTIVISSTWLTEQQKTYSAYPSIPVANLTGTVLHEMVHALQYNGAGQCPWYIIEGIADYVRIKTGRSDPRWENTGATYKNGYKDCAYLLNWLDDKYPGFVRSLNLKMKKTYNEQMVLELSGGKTWDQLFQEYSQSF